MVFLSNLPPPTVGIRCKQPNTAAVVEKKEYGSGTLYIAESQVSWMSDGGQGFALEYLDVSLHAISRDRSVFPQDCLYLQLSIKVDDEDSEGDSSGSAAAVKEDLDPITEVRFIPQDPQKLSEMYKAMCDCQVLHGDPDDIDSEENEEEEDDGDEFSDEEQEEEDFFTEQGRTTFERLENMLAADSAAQEIRNGHQCANGDGDTPMETGQFEDVEQME